MFVDMEFKDPVKVTASEDASGFTIEASPADFLRYVTKFRLKVIDDGPQGRISGLRVHDNGGNCVVTNVKKF